MANRPTSAASFRRPSHQEVRRFRLVQFFQDVVSELRKAVWPTREETMRLTWVVIVVAAVVGSMLGVLDFVLSRSFTRYIILP